MKGLGDKLNYPGNKEYLQANDIILLCETWLHENSNPSKYHIPGFKKFNIHRKGLHSRATRSSGGILVYIRKDCAPNIKIVKEVCDHFVVLEIKTKSGFVMYLIMCYIPPSDTTYVCKSCDSNYYFGLRDLVIHYSKRGPVSVCGDLNAHTAIINENLSSGVIDPSDPVEPVVWSRELPDRVSVDKKPVNDHGADLLSICIASGLRIMNGRCFADKGVGKATFIRGECQSVLDYLLLQENIHGMLSNFYIGDKWPESDHCPLHFEFTLPESVQRQSNSDNPADNYVQYSRFAYKSDDSKSLMECLCDETGSAVLNEFYDSIFSLESSSQVCSYFDRYIKQACERSLKKCGKPKQKSKFPSNPWFGEECKRAKSDFHAAQKQQAPHSVLNELERTYKRVIQQSKRSHDMENLSSLQACRNQQELWAKLNKLKRKDACINEDLTIENFYNFYSKPAIDNVNNCFDFDLSHEQDLKNFFDKFVNSKGEEAPLDIDSESFIEDDLIRYVLNATITNEEIMAAILKLKKGKSPGVDGVPFDIFKDCSSQLVPILNTLLNYMFEQGEYPDSWSQAVINPVPKVSCPNTTDNFRRISVLPAASKIYDEILNNRMVFIETAFEKGDPFNGGFKSGSRTSDNLFILNAILEKYRCKGKPLFVCFVDFKRAFDCVNRALMFVKLMKVGYSSKLLTVMINMYSKTTSLVKWRGYLSKSFQDLMGVAQGGVSSPFLFKSFLSDLGKHLNDDCGVVLHESIVKHLLWADDLFLVSPSADLMQVQLANLKAYCSQWQMVVNTMKTKIIVFGVKNSKQFTFNFGDSIIETCDSYSYLGNLIKGSRNPFTKIDEVILHKCFRACYKIRDYVEALGQLTPSLAVHFFNTLVAPILDYGSEVWYSEGVVSKLEIFQKKYYKRNLSVRMNTPDHAVFGELGVLPLSVRLKGNVLKYIHRLNTLPNTSPVKWAYLELKSLHDAGYDTWYKKALSVLLEFEDLAGLPEGGFFNLKSSIVKRKVKSYNSTAFIDQWLSDVNDSNVCSKLRTYKLFKDRFRFEKYLHIPNKRIRQAISRFRMSSHHLAIELGRHQRPKTPAEQRLCTVCNVVQDEKHHILECQLTEHLRESLLNSARNNIPRFEQLNLNVKFVKIMRCDVKEFLMTLGDFLLRANEIIKDPSRHAPRTSV